MKFFKIIGQGFVLYYGDVSADSAEAFFNEDVGPFPKDSYTVEEINETDIPEDAHFRFRPT